MKRYLLTLITMFSISAFANQNGSDIQPNNYYPQVLLVTSLGNIIVELDRKRAPITVNNFLWLTKNKEYNNTIFHRVIKDFVVQGGGVTPDLKQILSLTNQETD